MTVSSRLLQRRGRAVAFVGTVLLALGLIVGISTTADAVVRHRVKLVNRTGETLWIGSRASTDDGSGPVLELPKLLPGIEQTVEIPYTYDKENRVVHWRGTFFARQRCSGTSGVDFRCQVADCGRFEDRCEFGEQPASLAEFNFDLNDANAPWYDVSYVNALSLAITIDTPGADRPDAAGTCVRWSCSGGQLLAACPDAHAEVDTVRGDRINCLNPNRDAETVYTRALGAFAPRAYLWSTHDRIPGNLTMYNCPRCEELVVTFRSDGRRDQGPSREVPKPSGTIPAGTPGRDNSSFLVRGLANKCLGVPHGISADGVQMQLWQCNKSDAQSFAQGPGGSLRVLGKCLDVAWAARENGAKVQLAWCNGGPAQVWEMSGTLLRNPHSGKCLDVRDANRSNGAPLQIWTCNPGQGNQSWHLVPA
ncbi:ricin-type beta-trefoil lectin domain protein [Micromonospora sp. NPDC050795]|uniref:ricin-type beta-trefoil lectin domain protein n=1 Tax=Micromonospora sp. NPDC050795 TaxID=3364282 RepID=UPI00379F6090